MSAGSAVSRSLAAALVVLVALVAGPAVGSAFAQSFSINNFTNFEGGSLSFTITCTDAPAGAPDNCAGATVNFATQDNTAVSTGPNIDYGSLANTVTFSAAGSEERSVSTVNDVFDEDAETFFANLSSPSAGTIADNQGLGTINDGDPPPDVSINNAGASEGGVATFTLTLTPASGKTVSVQADTQTGTADFADFGAFTSFPITFDPGQTSLPLSVSHFCDESDEGNETYTVLLHDPVNANTSLGGEGAGNPGVGTIIDPCPSVPGSGGAGGGSGNGADLYILKQETADPVVVGADFDYTIGVYNFGSSVAQNVTVIDNLPGGLQFVSATPSQGTCSGTTTVTCTLPSISPGATQFVAIRVRSTAESVIQNTATVTSSTFDPFTANNSSTALTQSYLGGTPPAGIPNPGASIATLRGSRTCVWSEGPCAVDVDCTNLDLDCTAVGRGRVLVSGQAVASRAFRFRRARRTVAAQEVETLSFRLGADARRAVRRALRRGRRVRARVRVTVTDAAGNRIVRRRTLRVVR